MLSLLNEQLQKNGVTGELCIVGGAAMILAFGSRKSTRDIDALVMAPASVRAAVAQVAEANGLPPKSKGTNPCENPVLYSGSLR